MSYVSMNPEHTAHMFLNVHMGFILKEHNEEEAFPDFMTRTPGHMCHTSKA